jgi:hypothetical protein
MKTEIRSIMWKKCLYWRYENMWKKCLHGRYENRNSVDLVKKVFSETL